MHGSVESKRCGLFSLGILIKLLSANVQLSAGYPTRLGPVTESCSLNLEAVSYI